ncbi:MAG: phosphatase PAP2 family protein [Vicinamibacteraceae bacterium]
MRVSEWIAVAYFIGTAVVAVVQGVRGQGSGVGRRQGSGVRRQQALGVKRHASGSSARRRLMVAALALVAAALVIALAAVAHDDGGWWLTIARDWAPAAYLMFGYWLPGGLQRPPNPRLEAWLARADRRLLAWVGTTLDSPFWHSGPLEAVYLLVYPFVPACFLLVYVTVPSGVSDIFWSAVLVSGYACYGTLPWLPARPPRQIDAQDGLRNAHTRAPSPPGHRLLRRLNEQVSGSMGVGGDTLPSGHVAVAAAAALVVVQFLPLTGALLVLLTLVIAAATVAGRYHYLVDAVGGLAVGLLAWLVLTWIH